MSTHLYPNTPFAVINRQPSAGVVTPIPDKWIWNGGIFGQTQAILSDTNLETRRLYEQASAAFSGTGFGGIRTPQAWLECQRSGIGVVSPTNAKGYPGTTMADGGYCYICGLEYRDRFARANSGTIHQMFGAECEHIIPYFLLLNMVGINHPTWEGHRKSWWKKNHGKVPGGYTEFQHDSQNQTLWKKTYLWSCTPCNQQKSSAPFVDVAINNGTFTIPGRNLPAAQSQNGILVGNLEQHITGLLVLNGKNAQDWRSIYREKVKEEQMDSALDAADRTAVSQLIGAGGEFIGDDDHNRNWIDATLDYAKGNIKPLVTAWQTWQGDANFPRHSAISQLIARQFMLYQTQNGTAIGGAMATMINHHFSGTGTFSTTPNISHLGVDVSGGGKKRLEQFGGGKTISEQFGGGIRLNGWEEGWVASTEATEYMFMSEILALGQTELWLEDISQMNIQSALGGFGSFESMLVYLPVEGGGIGWFEVKNMLLVDDNCTSVYMDSIRRRWRSSWEELHKVLGAERQACTQSNFMTWIANYIKPHLEGDGRGVYEIVPITEQAEINAIYENFKVFIDKVENEVGVVPELSDEDKELDTIDLDGEVIDPGLTANKLSNNSILTASVSKDRFDEYSQLLFHGALRPREVLGKFKGRMWDRIRESRRSIIAMSGFNELYSKIRQGTKGEAVRAVGGLYGDTAETIAGVLYTDDTSAGVAAPETRDLITKEGFAGAAIGVGVISLRDKNVPDVEKT